ncbi:hypothetical protein HanIR_Chr09g0448611 [Helianthus annuus]|nr:hypothetical protein HanIR_Chr09g0448611 [Helianthus annuus]
MVFQICEEAPSVVLHGRLASRFRSCEESGDSDFGSQLCFKYVPTNNVVWVHDLNCD